MQAQTGHIHGEIRTSQRHSLVTRRAAVPKSALRRTPVRTRMAAASEKVTFTSSQGHKTVGEYVKADTKSNKCAILCHGYTSHRDSCHFEPLAQAFANAGVNTLRFDFPGNGESEGTFRFGNYLEEVDDINAAKRYLEQQRGQEVVAVVGHSKGGDDVILYAAKYDDIPMVVNVSGRFHMDKGVTARFGDDILERVKQGPIEMTAKAEGGRTFQWHLTKQDLDVRMGLDMKAASQSIKKSKVLNIHGSGDTTIPVEDAHSFTDAIKGSTLHVVQGADHNFRKPEHAQEYVAKTVEFVTKHL
eukprot:jgi/Chrzof1/10548/Cz05g03010.t1